MNKTRCLIATTLAALPALGCASVRTTPPPWNALACFPQPQAVPRVTVFGSLAKHLPRYRATSALEVFLYGPAESDTFLLRNAQGMTLLGDRILVCDQGRPDVVAVNLRTGKTGPWCDPDHPPRCPVDIATGPDGRVYLADTTLRSVLVYEPDGTYLEQLMRGSGPDSSFRPCALLVADGVLYAGNLDARRLERFDLAAHTWLPPFAPPAEQPSLIAPTGLCRTPDDLILIADAVQGLVHRVTAQGRWLDPLGSRGSGPGQFVRPKQICCTSSGLILVADAGRQSVLAFDAKGRYLTELLERPDHWDGWTLPMGLLLLPPSATQLLTEHAPGPGPALPRQCVVVSDSMGKPSLTLLGVVETAAKEYADAF